MFGQGKDAPRIAMAHEIPYVATATVADLHDLEAKVTRAMEFHGARYLHVLVPCPLGWGTGVRATRSGVARLATRERAVPGLRGRGRRGRRRVSPIRRQVPVEDYLRPQKPLSPTCSRPRRRTDVIARIQAHRRPQHPPLRTARTRSE